MHAFKEEQKKQKKERNHKKWSSEEIKCILNYMENTKDVELPTAQAYYKKLITETGINATWDLIKWKVRYLKTTFRKARDWRNSPDARLLECDEGTKSVDAKVLQICPQFHRLNNIFGERLKTQISWHEIIDAGETIETDFIKIDADEADETSNIVGIDSNVFDESSASNYCSGSQTCDYISVKEISSDKNSKNSRQKSSTSNIRQKVKDFSNSIKNSEPRSLISYLADFQAEKTSLFKMKFEWERQKHLDEMELNRKNIALKEEKTKAEIELKKQELELRAREIERRDALEKTKAEIELKKHELELRSREIERKHALEEEKTKAEVEFKKHELELKAREIDRDERLKVLEIEKDERIKKYEIEMKLKYQNNHS